MINKLNSKLAVANLGHCASLLLTVIAFNNKTIIIRKKYHSENRTSKATKISKTELSKQLA